MTEQKPQRTHPRATLAVFVLLLVLLVCLGGCAARGTRGTGVGPQGGLVSPESGYDPAWSSDGARIAYVEAGFIRDSPFGLVLDNDPARPTARDMIRVWDLRGGTSSRLRPASARGTFISSLAWLSNSKIAFLASDLFRRTPEMPKEQGSDWQLPLAYRILVTRVVVTDVPTGASRVILEGGRQQQLESARGGAGLLALWECAVPGTEGRSFTVTVLDRDARVLRHRVLPRADWVGVPVGTARTTHPVLIRRNGKGANCLSTINGTSYDDFYCPDRRIAGVFGSPDAKAVAVLEEGADGRYLLRVLRIGSGDGVVVAEDPYPLSRVTWSPDSRRIAYTRAGDGHITIADVPRIP